ncbi:hypothetical protein MesoLj113c_14430 [Mesorhizobium sp. 113-3-9]|uniref:hypothetical protein n=1 Tax=Mesorhizobium sp. 113-3-9 TaxID=2744517 RepID=UPI0019257224|nr:hypothetical protein [Mesorhizobium sp. 113-3-9]BCG85333.1 hypothetical protein MesoLj113c_14430 [Mesorhizobium sp. 113-3-9]
MKRGLFSKVVGVSEENLKTLRRRNQLPFPLFDDDGHDEGFVAAGREPQAVFSVLDALKLRLALDMTIEGGVSPDVAAKAVSNAIGYLAGKDPFALADDPRSDDIFIGIERYRARDGKSKDYADYFGANHYAGNLRDIALESEKRAGEDYLRSLENGESVSRMRLVLVNLSAAARDIAARAEKFGVTNA